MSVYIIYKTINLINNKIYVGQHNTSANDGYIGSGKTLKKAIEKYGRNNFKREILEYCSSADVNDKEIFWISYLSATNKKIGYNITKGGDGYKCFGIQNHFYGKHHNKSSIEKISKSKFGKIPWNKGLTYEGDDRVKKYIDSSKVSKNGMFNGIKNPMFGKKHSDETKKIMSKKQKGLVKSNRGIRNGNAKIVTIITPDGKIFENTTVNSWFRMNGEKYEITKSFLRSLTYNKIIDNRGWKCYFK